MKIVQINGSFDDSTSTGRSTKEMHAWLQKQGHVSYVFVSDTDGEKNSGRKNVFVFLGKTSRKIHAFLSHITGLQGYFSVADTARLTRHLKQINPDIVILGVLHNNSINFPLLCKYLASYNIPTVLVLHDCWLFTGHCCYYTSVGCTKWKTDCKRCPQIREWNTSWLFDTANKCLKDKKRWFSNIPRLGAVGVSDWIIAQAEQSFLGRTAVLKRIYNWIDLSVFHPWDSRKLRDTLGIRQNEPVLLGVSSVWSEEKGKEEVLLAAKKFSYARIVLVGKISDHVAVHKNLICMGTIQNPVQLAQLYSMAEVFMNPSVQETFGKTTAEALCCGTPVVAYDTTACTELVGTGCGELVKCRAKDKFLEAVKRVLQNGKSQYSNACLCFAKSSFSLEKNMREYIDFFMEIQSGVM